MTSFQQVLPMFSGMPKHRSKKRVGPLKKGYKKKQEEECYVDSLDLDKVV